MDPLTLTALAVPAVVSAGAALYGAATNKKSVRAANRANAAEAEKNRQFQKEMRDSAFQSQIRDMRLAGINPILSAKLGGAAQPAGAQATMQADQSGQMIAEAGQVGNDLFRNALTASQVDVNKAQADKLRADTQTTNESRIALVEKIKAEVSALDLKNQLDGQLLRHLDNMNPLQLEQLQKALEQLDLANKHSKADLNRALNEAEMEEFFSGPAGNWLRLFRSFINSSEFRR